MHFAFPYRDENAIAKPERFKAEGADITFLETAKEAVQGADVVVTDQWPQDDYDAALREQYRVNSALLQGANDNYLFLQCVASQR